MLFQDMNMLLIFYTKRICPYAMGVLLLASCQAEKPSNAENASDGHRVIIHELNEKDLPKGNQVIAFVGATLIDGRGGDPIQNSCVIVRDNTIEAVGKQGDVKIPDGAQIEKVEGLTILPGMFDAHYHNENSATLPAAYVRHGITSVRDPGEWNESYAGVRSSGIPLPRLFLTGPHLNTYPPAYPEDAMIVQDAEEGRLAVEKLYRGGATAIKVYYGLPVGTIQAICTAAHAHGLPVMAHLEISNAVDAINAGLDGIEHVTSFGTVLLPPYDAEQYKQRVLANNDARKRGRYEAWNSFKFENNPVADSLIQFLARKKIFLSPTLAAFEKQPDQGDSIEVQAFKNMLTFVGLAKKGGVPIVLGSHTFVTYAEFGYAFYREMELLQAAGLSNMEIIVAATLENARYFRVDERLGSIEKGKLADLVFVEGDPLKDLQALRNAKKVLLNGAWVPMEEKH